MIRRVCHIFIHSKLNLKMSVIKIERRDFFKISNTLNLDENNAIELTFHDTDLEQMYYDEDLEDYVKTEAHLLEMCFDDKTVKILNKVGLNDDFIRQMHNDEKYFPCNIFQGNTASNGSIFQIVFEVVENWESALNDVNNPNQIILFTT